MCLVCASFTRAHVARARAVNLLVNGETGFITVIDQMVSVDHPNARDYFERDVNGLVKFFAGKMKYIPDASEVPSFDETDGTTGGDGAGDNDGSNVALPKAQTARASYGSTSLCARVAFPSRMSFNLPCACKWSSGYTQAVRTRRTAIGGLPIKTSTSLTPRPASTIARAPPLPPDVTEPPVMPPPIPVVGQAGGIRGDEDVDQAATGPDSSAVDEEGEQESAPIGSAWHAFLSGLGNDETPIDDAASELTDPSHSTPGGGMSHANRRKVRAQVAEEHEGHARSIMNTAKRREKDKVSHQARPSSL